MKVLAAEDARKAAQSVSAGLEGSGHSRRSRQRRTQGPELLRVQCATLDRMMPGMDGLSLLKGLRARVVALTRRRPETSEARVLRVAGLCLELLTRAAQRQGKLIELQTKEFALHEVLSRNTGRVITRMMLPEMGRSFNFDPKTCCVETRISRLRRKIDKPPESALIRNTPFLFIALGCLTNRLIRLKPNRMGDTLQRVSDGPTDARLAVSDANNQTDRVPCRRNAHPGTFTARMAAIRKELTNLSHIFEPILRIARIQRSDTGDPHTTVDLAGLQRDIVKPIR